MRGKKSAAYDWTPVIERVSSFDVAKLSALLDVLPEKWIVRREKLISHMELIVQKSDELVWELRKSLA